MTEPSFLPPQHLPRQPNLRDWLSNHLGVDQPRKAEIYLDLLQTVTLRDANYWGQVIFAAGIATLGLVLSSPAVIIGAMLISPLMGPILASGLAFAAGDLILAIRSFLSLCLSCTIAILFAIGLVCLLPFKEMTPEILARTSPNILDLAVALFSGAVAAVATSKRPTGVVTSIPGVAIAVALMPPLCVVGYGLGIAFSGSWQQGVRVAGGGGLLFLTNLAAIILMAMIVFVVLHIDTPDTRDRARRQHHQERESLWIQTQLQRFPVTRRLQSLGSLPSRFIVILFPILMLLFPLSRSFGQLSQEIAQKQQTNRLMQVSKAIWQEEFASYPDGQLRSFVSQFSTYERNGQQVIQLSIFTSQLYSAAEKQRYVEKLALRLERSPETINFQLIEVPTASNEQIARLFVEKAEPTPPIPIPTINLVELQTQLLRKTDTALKTLTLPQPAQLLRYEVTTSPLEPLRVNVFYISERAIDADGQTLLRSNIRDRLDQPTARVDLKWIKASPEAMPFELNQVDLSLFHQWLLDRLGETLQEHPELQVVVMVNRQNQEAAEIESQRRTLIQSYLQKRWQIARDRITTLPGKSFAKIEDAATQLTIVKKPN